MGKRKNGSPKSKKKIDLSVEASQDDLPIVTIEASDKDMSTMISISDASALKRAAKAHVNRIDSIILPLVKKIKSGNEIPSALSKMKRLVALHAELNKKILTSHDHLALSLLSEITGLSAEEKKHVRMTGGDEFLNNKLLVLRIVCYRNDYVDDYNALMQDSEDSEEAKRQVHGLLFDQSSENKANQKHSDRLRQAERDGKYNAAHAFG